MSKPDRALRPSEIALAQVYASCLQAAAMYARDRVMGIEEIEQAADAWFDRALRIGVAGETPTTVHV